MELIRGSKRLVLLAGPIAIKFPRIRFKWLGIPLLCKMLLRGRWTDAKEHWVSMCLDFMRGMISNLTEAACYLWFRAPFLVPVISCGLISVQKREYGETPTSQEIQKLLEQLPPRKHTGISSVDPHHFDGDNWKKNERGYRLVDYGDSLGDFVSLSGFLLFNYEAMAALLCKK